MPEGDTSQWGKDETIGNAPSSGLSSSESAVEPGVGFRPGDIVGDTYRIEELIGKGGMGHVFRVKHTIIGQEYALKVLPPELASESNWRRFQSEGKTIARLSHQNVVHIYNMGVDRTSCPFYVMDLLPGASLADVIKISGSVPLSVTIEIFIQLCRGLSYAHRVGVIHRDVKPSNVILHNHLQARLTEQDPVPQVKIVDFGLAKMIRIQSDSLQRLTNTGEIFGTPLYMSPEQCMGETVDARSDVYSLGCALYETLTGRPPFRGENAMATVLMHMEETPRPLSKAYPPGKFSQPVEQVVARMLNKDPRLRHQTMDQVAHDLERIKHGKSVMPAGESSLPGAGKDMIDPPPLAPYRQRLNPKWLILAASIVLVAGAGVFGLFFPGHEKWQKAVKAPASEEIIITTPSDSKVKLAQAFSGIPTFSQGVINTGSGRMRKFQFSKEYPVGILGWGKNVSVPCSGVVYVPEQEHIHLVLDCDHAFTIEEMPSLLRKFAPDDISSISSSSTYWAKILQQVHDWTKLDNFCLQNLDVKASEIPEIDKLEHLTDLSFEACSYDSNAVARLKVLPRLEKLQLSKYTDPDIVVRAIAGSTSLIRFDAGGAPITAATIAELARCPNLKDVRISARNLRDQDLTQFENFPSLKILSMEDCHFTTGCLPYLRRLTGIKTLVLRGLKWPGDQKDRLKLAVPAYVRHLGIPGED